MDLIEYTKIIDINEYNNSAIPKGAVAATDYAFELSQFLAEWWWCYNPVFGRYGGIVNTMGGIEKRPGNRKDIGIRPVLIPKDTFFQNLKFNQFERIQEFIYGSYPQSYVEEDLSEELESDYNNVITGHNSFGVGKLTGRVFSYDAASTNMNQGFIQVFSQEYEYKGKKYARLATPTSKGIVRIKWFEVEPIKWLYDNKTKLIISKNILLSSVCYGKYLRDDHRFFETDLFKYLTNFFEKEIEDCTVETKIVESKNVIDTDIKRRIKKENPYGFDFSKVTEEDIIKGSIESNVSVFLHGKSSEGKSARVKQLDPDCEIIYMRNVTPDSLNGKSVYNQNTGEMIDIPPTWYTKLKDKCEKEPNKLHLVFFDELTNALPSIQGMAFNIILDGEINGKWKLPENARIVAAGNDLNDSLAANQMAEPLFNRFAHVYINTTVEDWLNWAVTEEESYEKIDYIKDPESDIKIHPAIYSYIAYNSAAGIDNVLRTPFTGEKPNADPRKWEMASKVLTKTNKPEMLRALVGEEITSSFVQFTKQEVITLEDVLNDNYTEGDLNIMNLAEEFSTAAGLSGVDEKNLKKVRNFMKKLGKEVRAAFDVMWAHGDQCRLEIIANLIVEDEALEQEELEKLLNKKIKINLPK